MGSWYNFLLFLSELLLSKESRMSASITRAEGLTVLTVTSDGDPVSCPLFCQLMCMLCYCPGVNLFKRQLSPQRRSQSVLGALQIMIGVLNIGLGLTKCRTYQYYYYEPSFAAWFGVVFIIVGMTSILSERFSCSLMVVLSVILNLCGVAFALTTLIHYSMQMSLFMPGSYYDFNPCKKSEDSDHYWYRNTTPSNDLDALQEKCLENQALMLMLQTSVLTSLITLSCLELCVVISSATLNIKALKNRKSESKEPEPERAGADPSF